MRRTADRDGAGTGLAVVRRPGRFTGLAATERGWLAEGFEGAEGALEAFLVAAPSPLLRHTHRMVAVLLVVLVALASMLRVDVIVAGSGRLQADAPMVALQPMQLSVIRQIRVRPGDLVHKGEVLAALDPTFTQADRAVLVAQQAAVRARLGRLSAELDGTGFEAGEGAAGALQDTLFRQRAGQYAARLADFGQRLQGLELEAQGAEQARQSLLQQLALSREVEGMRGTLFRSQSGSRLAFVEAQGMRIRAERELQAAVVQANAVQQSMRGVRAERQAFTDDWRRELLEELVRARAEALAVDESLTKANRLNELVMLTAPEDGVVLEVAKRSVGSVLNAAEPLITLVPSDAALVAEVLIGSADVGYVKPGDAVAVKVDAFPYQRHGVLMGRLRSVGAESVASGGAAFHRGMVEIGGEALRGLPEGTRLIPGMTVVGEVKVGTRLVIAYVLDPILRGLGESIREP